MLSIFIAATFFESVTILNMLIAIMGDSFANFMEMKDINSTRTKLEILAEHASVISMKHDKVELSRHYMFIAKPSDFDNSGNDSWQGSISKITRINTRLSHNLKKELSSKIDKLRDEMKLNSSE